ncbi:MAG: hypothetical protein KatS3mg108_3273 [Isosphaeraceae bacterium]|jgi:hypothetical protein|nr:MAG: hypothetical protein KatS3mg108_3273 [Isosphaeraceae bacterium]
MTTIAAPVSSAPQGARNRQILYAIAIVALFGAMWPYSEWLQRLKTEADLGEATIGQIDGSSFLQKLAVIGGLRGVATHSLWSQALELQKQHEWDKLKVAVDFITKLQPHFLSVWTFQGWNLAYNVSVEWDAPEDKYVWIKNGINYLREGVAKNRRSPDLIWDTAWTYYHKLGFADEAIILRRLFYDDPDEEGTQFKIDPISLDTRHDNFQVARGWFLRAIGLVDQGAERAETGVTSKVVYIDRMPDRKGRPGDLNFRAMPAHAQTRYAIGMEKMSKKDIEPLFGQFAIAEWDQAYKDWLTFGKYPFPAHNNPEEKIFLDDITNPERYYSAELSDNQRYWTNRWADQMNYRYWKDRCDAEREEQGVNARRFFYEGTRALRLGEFATARDKFKAGLSLWKELLDRHPTYRDDELNQKDTGELARRYAFALKQLGEDIPEDMPFKDIYELVKNEPFRDPFDQLDQMRVGETTTEPNPPSPPAAR